MPQLEPHETIRAVSDAVLERAAELNANAEWIPGKVIRFDRETRIATLVLDEDLLVGAGETVAASLIGDLGPGQRVMVQRVGAAGVAVVGQITALPWQQWQPAIINDGGSIRPTFGAAGYSWGKYQIRNNVCVAHVRWRFASGFSFGSLGFVWIFDLPVPVTADWPEAAMNVSVGTGWVYMAAPSTAGSVNTVVPIVVDAPVGGSYTDPRYAGMRVSPPESRLGDGLIGAGRVGGGVAAGVPTGLAPSYGLTSVIINLVLTYDCE